MGHSARVYAPHLVLLIMDPDCGEVPETMVGCLVSVTASCIAIGTISQPDEFVLVEILDEAQTCHAQLQRVGSWQVNIENKRLAVCSVLMEQLLVVDINSNCPEVELWANDASDPDHIAIVLKHPRTIRANA